MDYWDEATMDKNQRTLKWCDDVLKFPCGIKVNITAEKLRKIFGMFKVPEKAEEMITTGQSTLQKGRAFQIKDHLT